MNDEKLRDDVFVNPLKDNIKRQIIRNRLHDKQSDSYNCAICSSGSLGDRSKIGAIY